RRRRGERRRGNEQKRVVPAVLRIEAGNGELTLGRQVASDRLRILDEPAVVSAGDTEDRRSDPRRQLCLFILAVFAALAELAVTELDQVDDDRVIGPDQVGRRLVRDLRIAERHSPLVADELPPLEVRERVTDIPLAPRGREA